MKNYFIKSFPVLLFLPPLAAYILFFYILPFILNWTLFGGAVIFTSVFILLSISFLNLIRFISRNKFIDLSFLYYANSYSLTFLVFIFTLSLIISYTKGGSRQ